MAVRPGASGDITLGEKDTKSEFVAWVQRQAAPYNPSFLLYQDYLYVVREPGGIFACYDAKTGEVAYEKKRLPNGRAFTASPFAYNGHVFCLSEYGETFVLKAGPEYELVRVNSLGPDEMCLATPAIVGDKLLIRGDRTLFAIGKKTAADKSAK
jgi:outer membrane protein assembly factor BamB